MIWVVLLGTPFSELDLVYVGFGFLIFLELLELVLSVQFCFSSLRTALKSEFFLAQLFAANFEPKIKTQSN